MRLEAPVAPVTPAQRPTVRGPFLFVGDRTSEREHLVPLLVNGHPNPEGHRFDADRPGRPPGPGRRPRSRFFTPRRVETVERLAAEDLLPAIYFIFSRNGCDEAVRQCFDAGLRLTSSEERVRIRELAEQRTAALSDDDLDVLGHDRWLEAPESERMHLSTLVQQIMSSAAETGGIRASDVPAVLAAGASGVAVVSSVVAAPDVRAATRALRDALDRSR